MAKKDKKLIEWIKWMNIIHKDTESILINKDIHSRYLEIIKANKDIQSPSDFHEWTIRNYGSYVVMAIRRQLDSDNDVISLKRLLIELVKSPQFLTKHWFRSLYSSPTNNLPIPMESFADGDFENYAGNMEHFDPAFAEADLTKLETLGKSITRYVNKQIAHRTKVEATLTFSEINQFLDEFETIVKKYILLFTASGYVTLTPTCQYDWETIFTKAWIRPHADYNN